MTTSVKIGNTINNHKDFVVKTIGGADGETEIGSYRVPEGEERVFYVYKGQKLLIEEVDKLA